MLVRLLWGFQMRKLILTTILFLLLGCQQNVIEIPEPPVTVYTASEQELMDFYRGLHLVGVRLLSEEAGSGGRANLERFYHFYFSGNYSEAQKYLRKSLFADPFNDDSKAVAAQLETLDLFGLLNQSSDQQIHQVVQKRQGESLLQLSRRIYGTEHLAVLLDRYNTHVNPDFASTGQIYVPNTNRLGLLMDYVQTSPSNQNRRAVAPASTPPSLTPTSVTEPDDSQTTVSTTVLDAVEAHETESSQIVATEDDVIEQPQAPNAQDLYQQGNLIGAYRLLRTNRHSDEDQRLFATLQERLLEAPYQRAVKSFHEQDVRLAIEGFRRVLSIEPDHQRAQQYLNRAIQLEARLRNID